jgi:4-hydroxybenzoate-CoA ligase
MQTYAQLAQRSDLIAGAFVAAGLRREERVACLILDQLEYPEVFWGAIKAGVVPVPLNTLLATSVYAAILSDSRAACLIVSHEIWETVAPALAGNIDLRKVIMIGADAPAETLSYSKFLAPAKPQTAVHASDDECAF